MDDTTHHDDEKLACNGMVQFSAQRSEGMLYRRSRSDVALTTKQFGESTAELSVPGRK